MLIGALLFAVVFTASGYFLYRRASTLYGKRMAASMISQSHVRTLAVLGVAWLLARSGGTFGASVVESVALIGLAAAQAVSLLVRARVTPRAGGPLLLPHPGRSRIVARGISALLAFGAFVIGARMIEAGAVTLPSVAWLLLCAVTSVTALQASRGRAVLFERGVLGRFSFLPWSHVQGYRWIEYEQNAELQLVLGQPWRLRNEIAVVVPRGNQPSLHEWLGQRLPCLGIQRRLSAHPHPPA